MTAAAMLNKPAPTPATLFPPAEEVVVALANAVFTCRVPLALIDSPLRVGREPPTVAPVAEVVGGIVRVEPFGRTEICAEEALDSEGVSAVSEGEFRLVVSDDERELMISKEERVSEEKAFEEESDCVSTVSEGERDSEGERKSVAVAVGTVSVAPEMDPESAASAVDRVGALAVSERVTATPEMAEPSGEAGSTVEVVEGRGVGAPSVTEVTADGSEGSVMLVEI